MAVGQRLFPGVTGAAALKALRFFLEELQVPEAHKYRCHDLRQGHAKDLQLAGEWRSVAFMKYLDLHRLETELVVQAHCDESEDED
eukprot:12201417-Karenia_brevis.AAC.1